MQAGHLILLSKIMKKGPNFQHNFTSNTVSLNYDIVEL